MSDSEMPKFTPFLDLPLEYGQVLEPIDDKESIKTVHTFDKIISSKLSGEKKDPNGKSVDRYFIHNDPNGKVYHYLDKMNGKFVIEYDRLGEYMIPGRVWEIIQRYVPKNPNVNFSKKSNDNKVSSVQSKVKQVKSKEVKLPVPLLDKVIRKLNADEAQSLYQFDKSLGKEDKGFYRWNIDSDFKTSHGIVYHYISLDSGKDYRIRYQVTPNGRLQFTGDVVELEDDNDDPNVGLI